MSILDWIDTQLGRITMYRLVLYGLVAMVVVALLLMAGGVIGFSPLFFGISTIVCAGAAYIANRLFGWLFGIKPHSESALITGMILALLFIPPTAAIGFVKLALVATIAMASKYIIVIRGRHVFNPAAIAVVIASISELAFAGWWIATPGMVPVTLLVATIILYRTKKLRLGLVFIGISVAALLLRGTDPVTALTSWPLLFVAGVMLSEPLTLPPRAYQQYMIAGIVAVLMTVPLQYGLVTMTPALALVIGNAIGWWFGQRRMIKLRYAGKKQMNHTTYDFTFDATSLRFEAGQYLELTIPHSHSDSRGERRIFSIVARPGDEQISIGTKIPQKPSSFKHALMRLQTGDTVYATRVAGDFVLPSDTARPIVCIAGGIGVTPFISFCLSTNRPFQLIYAVSSARDMSYVEQLRQHAVHVTVVSPDNLRLPDQEWKHRHGPLTTKLLDELIDVAADPVVYISGPPGMVMETRRLAKTIGVRRIKVDEFSGY